jgi:hypothetical protein
MSSQRMGKPRRRLVELNSRSSAHAAPPTVLQQLDELEEELRRELHKADAEKDRAKENGRSGLS